MERSMSATTYCLPSISRQRSSMQWRAAQHVINRRIESESAIGDEEYEESGSDLSDCESDSAISTILSQASTLTLNAASDPAIDHTSDQIPLFRAPPYPILSTTIRFVYPDTGTMESVKYIGGCL